MAPTPKITPPDFILFEVDSLKKLSRVGEYCDRVCSRFTGRTNICDGIIALHFDKRIGFAYELRYGCGNPRHQTKGV